MFWSFVMTLILAAVILAVGSVLGSWLAGVSRLALEQSGLDPLVRRLVVSLVRPLVMVIAFVAAMTFLGVDLTAVIAVLGAATLAVGLALRDSLANVAAGALLLTLRPFSGGDFVDAAGESGGVTDLGLFFTGLERGDGVVVSVPNNLILKSPIRNYTRAGNRRAEFVFRVGATTDPDKLVKTLTAALASDERIVGDPPPNVQLLDIDSRGLKVQARVWLPGADFAQVKSDLLVASLEALKKAKIQLASEASILELSAKAS